MGEGTESSSSTEWILDGGRQIRKDRTRGKCDLRDVSVCGGTSPERTTRRERDEERARQRSTRGGEPSIQVHRTGEETRILLQFLHNPLALRSKR